LATPLHPSRPPLEDGLAGKRPVEAVLAEQQVELAAGLSSAEAAERLRRIGPNALAEKRISPWLRLVGYFWGPIPWMIEAAAILSLILGDWSDFAIIAVMLLVNVGVEFWEENKADNAIALLKQKLALVARVLRDGQWRSIDAQELVPGDIIQLQIGNIVPADAALIAGDYFSADESTLTGESLPVDKAVGDPAYSGSVVKLGDMRAVVTATGINTFFGKTARLVGSAQQRSHFQRTVLKIGNFLILATLALIVLIVSVALFRHAPLLETIAFALILTVAAIPVALPTVLSVTMAVGAERLAEMKAIVSRLAAIEELAGVDVLCADKTGTLTKNELTLGRPEPFGDTTGDELVFAAALACQQDIPDPIDRAVLAGLAQSEKLRAYHVHRFLPFDPVRKRTEAEISANAKTFTVSKGAPQVILELFQLDPIVAATINKEIETLAAEGYRTIAVARRPDGGSWRYLGLLPIFDPPRDDSAETIERTRKMGIDVKMITGDHEAISRQIAGRLRLGTNIVSADRIFGAGQDDDIAARINVCDGVARVLPEHKYKIVKALQSNKRDHIVGMTGDGVNDAPALKQADVGIAVSGATDAARAAADVVLTAPGLSVITAAIEEARRIFERMTSYATFRIAETIRVLLFMTLSILIFDFYPLTPVMIVMLAILNDVPIMMIAYDNAPSATKPVRWDMDQVLSVAVMLGISGVAASFVLFWYAESVLGLPRDMIQTLIFLKLLVAGHLTIYVTRSKRWFWSRPWPSIRLFIACEVTQIVGTLLAVYGYFVYPIGWSYALAVWGYALAWLPLSSLIAVAIRSLVAHASGRSRRLLQRTETSLRGR